MLVYYWLTIILVNLLLTYRWNNVNYKILGFLYSQIIFSRQSFNIYVKYGSIVIILFLKSCFLVFYFIFFSLLNFLFTLLNSSQKTKLIFVQSHLKVYPNHFPAIQNPNLKKKKKKPHEIKHNPKFRTVET